MNDLVLHTDMSSFPGMTATEAARQAQARAELTMLPSAHLFDSIVYGNARVTRGDDEQICGLLHQCQRLPQVVMA